MLFFFFKQKTAYEMRISDWSSDVCSSDLDAVRLAARPNPQLHVPLHVRIARAGDGLGEAGTTHAGAVHAEKLGVLLVQGFGDHLVDVSASRKRLARRVIVGDGIGEPGQSHRDRKSNRLNYSH